MRLARELAARLRQLLRRRREDAETEMELRSHLEMEAEKNLRAGLPPREAQRQAHVRLGGTPAIREAVRDARGARRLEDLIRDLGYALRAARRGPVFALAVVLSLAIPIGFNTTIFTVVDAVLFGPLPVVRPAQLVDVWTGRPEDPYTTTSYPDYLDLRAENDVFTDMAAHAPMAAVTRVDEATSLVTGETVTGNYFELLGLRPVRGRLLAPEDDRPWAPRVAVISSGLWERAFGRDPDVVGRTLYVRTLPYVIVGVAPPEFYGMPPIPGPDLWIPMTWIADLATMGISTWVPSPGETQHERRGYRWMFVKGRLREGVTLTQAAASLDVIMADLEAAYPESDENQRLSLADERRATAAAGGRPGERGGGGPDARGRDRCAGSLRQRHGHAAGPFRGAATRDRAAARPRREPAPPRAATGDRGPPPGIARRRGRAGARMGPAADAGQGGVAPRHRVGRAGLPARRPRVPVHGGGGDGSWPAGGAGARAASHVAGPAT